MENRRRDYRYHFPHPSGLRAQLALAGAKPVRLVGEIVDLSIGGALLRIDEQAADLTSRSRWIVQFSLPAQEPLSLSATFVHGETAGTPVCGFEFPPLADVAAQEHRDRVIWRFLLDEQRKLRRERLAAGTRE